MNNLIKYQMFVLIVMCVTPVLLGESSNITQRPPMFDFIFAKIQDNCNRIQTIQLEGNFELSIYRPDQGKQNIKGEMSVFRKGNSQSVKVHKKSKIENTDNTYENVSRSVLNSKYIAQVDEGKENPIMFFYEGDPIKSNNKATSPAMLHHIMNPLLYGFGDEGFPSSKKDALNDFIARWEVKEIVASQSKLYQLIQYVQNEDSAQPILSAMWTVDPGKDYFITNVKYYDDQGRVFREKEIEPQMIDGFGWCPRISKTTDYYPDMPSDMCKRLKKETNDNILRVKKITFNNIKMNEPIPEDTFTLKFLNLKKNFLITQYYPDGHEEQKIYREGLVLPPDVARGWKIDKNVDKITEIETDIAENIFFEEEAVPNLPQDTVSRDDISYKNSRDGKISLMHWIIIFSVTIIVVIIVLPIIIKCRKIKA